MHELPPEAREFHRIVQASVRECLEACRLQREAGFKILIVHYKGTSPALIDLIAGRVSAMVSPVPNLIEQFRFVRWP